jgi:hypothetical protein
VSEGGPTPFPHPANCPVGPEARADAFLTWCDIWATPQLGNHFPQSESIFAEITDSYHRISAHQFASMPVRQANRILNREFGEWDERLDRVLDDLAKMASFLGRAGRLVVPDTSALMEGVFFTDFDWHRGKQRPRSPCRPGIRLGQVMA